MSTSKLLGLVALISLSLLGACNDGSDSAVVDGTGSLESPSEDTANDDALAESMLLEIGDFPVGWAEEEASDEETPFDDCAPEEPEGRTGRAETGNFSSGGSTEISQTVAIFRSPAHANAVLDRFESIGDCLVRVVESGELDNDEATISEASFSPLSFVQHGDRTEAFRIKFHAKAKNETGFGSEVDAYIDAVFVILGRVGFSLQAVDVFAPFDSQQLEDFVSIAEAKVRTTLESSSRSDPGRSLEVIPTATSGTLQPSIGDLVDTGMGLNLTIHSYEAPIPSGDSFFSPIPGYIFASVDVEGCTEPSTGSDSSLNPYDFKLQMPDNTRIEPDVGVREPALSATNLLSNDCVRGFVTFQVPMEVVPSFVIYEGYDADFDPIIVKWRVSP